MTSVLTVQEIWQQFPEEWILVENPQTAPSLEVTAGTVLHHSKDRDEVYGEAMKRRPHRFAVLYTGTIPADMVVIL